MILLLLHSMSGVESCSVQPASNAVCSPKSSNVSHHFGFLSCKMWLVNEIIFNVFPVADVSNYNTNNNPLRSHRT